MRPLEFASHEDIMGFCGCTPATDAKVSAHIAAILGRSIKLVQEVWTKFLQDSRGGAHQAVHRTRAKPVLELFHSFVRNKRITRTRVVAKDITVLLAESGYVQVDMNNEKDTGACLRAVEG
ncbi:hypothetical protein ACHHYP_20849 [Achlya hypogyna]|uniref:Uncharacterized protein n=1 Tax=Achlya hypogyna TaxID=1202772 RepID=A0A1V9ZDX9_ACHHY|nr:hypothetical protein ACHHYP_20849 [Achlya hypogyna]